MSAKINPGICDVPDCPFCGRGGPSDLQIAERNQAARFRYFRERDALVAELAERGFVANVTLDGSIIITGCRP